MTDARFFETLEDAAGLRFDREEGSGQNGQVARSACKKLRVENKFCNEQIRSY